jgi:hypothetical protein
MGEISPVPKRGSEGIGVLVFVLAVRFFGGRDGRHCHRIDDASV